MHPTRDGDRRLTSVELAAEAGVELADVERLVATDALHPDADGSHSRSDVLQIRLVQAMADSGIDLDDVVWAIRDAELPLDRVAEGWELAESSGRTFAEFEASLGEHARLLPAVYAAFGLGLHPPDAIMRRDEEEVIAGFLEVWALVEDRDDVFVRAARIAGDGVRRLDLATLDLFDELGGAPPSRLRRGLPVEEAVLPSHLISTVMEQLFVWLHRRHTENEVFERIVARLEQTLARAGRRERRHLEPPAVAFVDLTGYTQLAASAGDDDAVRAATLLHSLALEAARIHNGRVVKLLGDGVVLRYSSAREAVASVAELMAEIAHAGLPPAHAGIAAGPIVARDGDIYGHTVNLASRIASHASAGELLVHADVTESVQAEGFEQEDAGRASLKGIVEPVRLTRVRLPGPSS